MSDIRADKGALTETQDIDVPEGVMERLAELRAKTLEDVGWSSIGELHEAYVTEHERAEVASEILRQLQMLRVEWAELRISYRTFAHAALEILEGTTE